MSAYPGSEQERRVAGEELAGFARAIFEHCGMSEEDAALLADTLVVADLRGVHSHVDGILREIRTSRHAAGADELYAPGGLEAATETRYHREGIPLNDTTLAGPHAVARKLGVESL